MPIFGKKPSDTGSTRTLKEDEVKAIFKRCDVNRDGQLDKEELKKAFTELGAYFPGWRANRALRYSDVNGNKKVDKYELSDLLDYALNLGYTLK